MHAACMHKSLNTSGIGWDERLTPILRPIVRLRPEGASLFSTGIARPHTNALDKEISGACIDLSLVRRPAPFSASHTPPCIVAGVGRRARPFEIDMVDMVNEYNTAAGLGGRDQCRVSAVRVRAGSVCEITLLGKCREFLSSGARVG